MQRYRCAGFLAYAVVTVNLAACSGVDAFCADDFCGDDAGTRDGGADALQRDAKTDAPNAHHDGGADASADGRAHEGGTTSDAAKDVTADSFVCDPTKPPSQEACVISEAYGVFVAPAANGGSDTSGMGSRAAPYATIGKGITQAKAAGKRVYACAATYAEQVVVNAAVDGVQVYGGLACPELADGGGDAGGAAWTYSGGLAAVEPAAVGYALDVESLATGAHFEDMAFAPQVAPSAPGGSSIAVMVNASMAVSFTRVSAKALAGVAGVSPGAPTTNWCATSRNGMPASGMNGAAIVSCSCPVFGSSQGGAGGSDNQSGGQGTSSPAAAGGGLPGATQTTPTCLAAAGSGGGGGSGATGTTGNAGSTGSLTPAGWNAASGGSGGAGDPGQGGGGGGGTTVLGGASGGAGGCGGDGGAGGGGGGASIALAIVSSTLNFTSVTLETAAGGAGGAGAAGEVGQAGGGGGSAGGECSGGSGGAGAGGSGGGGGAGGPSVGIAWTGMSTVLTLDGTPVTMATSLSSPSAFTSGGGGAFGQGGGAGSAATGGNPGVAGQPGPPGSSNAVVEF